LRYFNYFILGVHLYRPAHIRLVLKACQRTSLWVGQDGLQWSILTKYLGKWIIVRKRINWKSLLFQKGCN